MILNFLGAAFCVGVAAVCGFGMCLDWVEHHRESAARWGLIGAVMTNLAIALVGSCTVFSLGEWLDRALPQAGEPIHVFTWLVLMVTVYAGFVAACLLAPWWIVGWLDGFQRRRKEWAAARVLRRRLTARG